MGDIMKRIRIEPITTGRYQISQENPNPGGECLCSPYGHSPDCHGPYIVFKDAHVVTSGRRVIPVICAGTVKTFLLHVESGGEVGMVGSARPDDKDFDGGEPTDAPDLARLRAEYQVLANKTPLVSLPSWDEFLVEKGLDPHGSPNSSGTRSLNVTGIDPNAPDLVELLS
jgi:hypothetical protein